jgi:hypothetical protein
MTSRVAILMTTCVCAVAWFAPSAKAQTLAASCDDPGNLVIGFPDDRWAQTFIPSVSGPLTSAQVTVRRPTGTSGDFTLRIAPVDAGGFPTNEVLASAVVDDAAIPEASATMITALFDTPASVVGGQQYALVVTRPDDYRIKMVTNPCADGGEAYYSPDQTAAFGDFINDPDLSYFVYVTEPPAPPPPEPEPQAGDSSAPNATITKAPKDKTKKKTATFEFTGTDTRAVASFQCSLDGAAFAPCTSPHTVNVKKGEHTFQVRAIDEAGNVGPPASDSWKRKKKKK